MKSQIRINHNTINLLLLLFTILIGAYVRVIDIKLDVTGIQSTDPIRFVYQAKQIIELGRMPDIDMLRSAPLGEKTSSKLTLYPYVLAGLYKLLDLMHINIKLESIAIILPVILFAFTISVIYIMVQYVFDAHTALLSVNIINFIPWFVLTTRAGNSDRDNLFLLLSIISFLFYILSYLKNKIYLFRFLSALAMLLTGLTWQGVGIFIAVIITVELIILLTKMSYNYKDTLLLVCWVLPVSVFLVIFKPGVYKFLSQPYAFIAIVYPIITLLVSVLVSVTQRNNLLKKFLSLHGRLPIGIGIMALFVIVVLAPVCILWIPQLIKGLIQNITLPFGPHPLFQMINELQKLGMIGWAYWPGVFFVIIVIGLIIIVWDISKRFNMNEYLAILAIQLIVFGIAFSRLSSGASILNFTETQATLTIYWSAIVIGILSLMLSFLYPSIILKTEMQTLIDSVVIVKVFLVVWGILMLITLRSAIRFIYLFAIPGAIIGGYVIVFMIKRCMHNDRHYLLYFIYFILSIWQIYALFNIKIRQGHISVLVYIALALLTVFAILFIAKTSVKDGLLKKLFLTALILYIINLVSISPSPIFGGYIIQVREKLRPYQWYGEDSLKDALDWIRENTPHDAVIAANWENGSWINLVGNRANIVNEEQKLNWIDLMGKKFFFGNDVTNALEFLKSYEADYLLLTASDVEKLDVMVRATGVQKAPMDVLVFGSVTQKISFDSENNFIDQCYRYCVLNTETVSETLGSTMIDKDLHKRQIYPSSIYIRFKRNNGSIELINALIEIQRSGTIKYIAPQRIFYKGKIFFTKDGECLPCSIIIISKKDDMPENWHVIYMSQATQQLLPIRIFVLDELCNIFERVYPEGNAIDPAKYAAQVWKIHYPSNIKAKTEYLNVID